MGKRFWILCRMRLMPKDDAWKSISSKSRALQTLVLYPTTKSLPRTSTVISVMAVLSFLHLDLKSMTPKLRRYGRLWYQIVRCDKSLCVRFLSVEELSTALRSRSQHRRRRWGASMLDMDCCRREFLLFLSLEVCLASYSVCSLQPAVIEGNNLLRLPRKASCMNIDPDEHHQVAVRILRVATG